MILKLAILLFTKEKVILGKYPRQIIKCDDHNISLVSVLVIKYKPCSLSSQTVGFMKNNNKLFRKTL